MEQKDINNTIQFERYLDAEMSIEERQQFEKNLETDEVLRTEFLLYQKIIKTLEQSEKELLIIHQATTQQADLETKKQALFQAYEEQTLTTKEKQNFEERLKNEKLFSYEWNTYLQKQNDKKIIAITKRKQIYRRILAIAAVALLFVVGYWWIGQNSPNEVIVENFYELPENHLKPNENIVIKGDEVATHELLEQGLAAYENQDYDATIDYLNQYATTVTTTDTTYMVQLYIGIAYYEKGNYDKVIEALQSSDKIQDLTYNRSFRDVMQWHLALTYLKTNQQEKAFALFNYLAKDAEYTTVKRQANAIIKQLEE